MRALIADDSAVLRTIIADSLRALGVADMVEAGNVDDALKAFAQQEFDLVVTDRIMPGGGGTRVVQGIRAENSEVPTVMITATGSDREEVAGAIQAGVTDYLLKPLTPDALSEKLGKFCATEHV